MGVVAPCPNSSILQYCCQLDGEATEEATVLLQNPRPPKDHLQQHPLLLLLQHHLQAW